MLFKNNKEQKLNKKFTYILRIIKTFYYSEWDKDELIMLSCTLMPAKVLNPLSFKGNLILVCKILWYKRANNE